jgi:hypothetical protein
MALLDTTAATRFAPDSAIGRDDLLHTSSPLATGRTFAEPLGLFASAGTTEISSFLFRHILILTFSGISETLENPCTEGIFQRATKASKTLNPIVQVEYFCKNRAKLYK